MHFGPSAAALVVLAFVRRPTWEGLHRVFLAPKVLLGIRQRGGQQHRREVELDNSRRLLLWDNGDFLTLWCEAQGRCAHRTAGVQTRSQLHTHAERLPSSTVAVIRGLIEEGALSKAAKHLSSRGIASLHSGPGVQEKLALLHPTAPPLHLRALNLDAHVGVDVAVDDPSFSWEDACWDAVRTFPPGSASGPSGLRPSHLKKCLERDGKGCTLHEALVELCKMCQNGGLPVPAAPWFCASNLIPLLKKDGGIRPIAVGDTLRRVIGKTILRCPLVKADVEKLAPRQCGVGSPNACEMIGMGVQRIVSHLADTAD